MVDRLLQAATIRAKTGKIVPGTREGTGCSSGLHGGGGGGYKIRRSFGKKHGGMVVYFENLDKGEFREQVIRRKEQEGAAANLPESSP